MDEFKVDSAEVKVSAFANDILLNNKAGADGIITKDEISSYIADLDETKLTESKLDKTTLEAQLNDLFKTDSEDIKSAASVGSSDDTEETEGRSYVQLMAKVAQLNNMLEGFDSRIEILDTSIKNIEKQIDNAYEKFAQYEEEASKNIEKTEELAKDIQATKENAENDSKARVRHAIWSATIDYNPTSDGDWEKYINKKVTDASTSTSPLYVTLKNLCNDQGVLSRKTSIITDNIKTQCSIIEGLEGNLATLNSSKASLEAMRKSTADLKAATQKEADALKPKVTSAMDGGVKGTPTPKKVDDYQAILDKVPKDEMDLAENYLKEQGATLYDKLEDGSPRFIFAKGASVEEGETYHIYDMARWNENGDNSIVRLTKGYSDCSFNMIPCGNGGITPNTFEYGEGLGKEVFYMDDCSTMQGANCCYQTWSPLSFDTNGIDGFQTSTGFIDYDIDGDGIVDRINDSSESVLVFDADGNGKAGEDGSETFGNSTDLSRFGVSGKFNNGFEALGALANVALDYAKEHSDKLGDNKDLFDKLSSYKAGEGFASDGVLDKDELKIMENIFGLGITDSGYHGKIQSFSEAEIASINLSGAKVSDKTQLGDTANQIQTQAGATFTKTDGSVHSYADIWHAKYDKDGNIFMNSDSKTESGSIAFRTQQILSDINGAVSNANSASQSAKSSMQKSYYSEAQSAASQNAFMGEDKEKQYQKDVAQKEQQEKIEQDKLNKKAEQKKLQEKEDLEAKEQEQIKQKEIKKEENK